MNPKIRLIGRYGDYRVGQILNPPASLRKILFDRKLAVFHEEQTPSAEIGKAGIQSTHSADMKSVDAPAKPKGKKRK